MGQLVLIFVFIAAISADFAMAEVRVWTRIDGKKMEAEMIDKTDKTVTLQRARKSYEILLTDLSDEDRQYVANNEPNYKIRPYFECRTLKRSSYIPGKSNSSIKINVRLKHTKNAELELFIVWIGEGRHKNDKGVFKTETKAINMDGDYPFEVTYDHQQHPPYNKQHKAHTVYLTFKGKMIDAYYSDKGKTIREISRQELAKHLAQPVQ